MYDQASFRHGRETVASIGGGPIGAGWAAHFLARGYDVTGYLHSMSEETRLSQGARHRPGSA